MKYTHHLLATLLLILIGNMGQAQSDYFQQEVNYKIKVSLDDIAHTINCDIEIDYTNNSPDTLKELYFHLWPNAFSKRTTAYANQEVKNGDARFYFAPLDKRGNISNIDFKINGLSTEFKIEIKILTYVGSLYPNPC